MIITRAPLRITLGGGGTDLPAYYTKHGGYCISAAIDKYVYVSVMRPFRPGIYLKYSDIESVKTVDEVKHPIIREALRIYEPKEPQIEITTLADIPAGTGLGSSGSFTVALLLALRQYERWPQLSRWELADHAFMIEHDVLGEPCGKQDQYIAAFGGVTELTFTKEGMVRAEPLALKQKTLWDLEDNLLLFFTGYSRETKPLLTKQAEHTKALHYTKQSAMENRDALVRGDLERFVKLMNDHWAYKRGYLPEATTLQINAWYDLGIRSGALGGKLVGAGGGGFLLFYAADKQKLREAMAGAGLPETRFRFDHAGAEVIPSCCQ
jgi:D-glycero-alpha-D-manno-heptose-7-phosphate kinase